LPGCTVSHHGVEDGEEFSSESDEREFGWFSGLTQAQVESLEDGIEPGSVHGGQIETGPWPCSTTADSANPPFPSTVLGIGSDPDQ
jgi:hypothetical protein